jgi:proteasome lid subunit RPN8/RPN11
LRAAYREALPLEAAGFLLGSEQLVREVALARGSAGGRGEFSVPDYELRRIRAWAAERKLRIVALFHSHPGGDVRLSPADEAALRHSEWPWVVITQAAELEIAAYRPPDGRPLPCRIET